MENVIDLVQFFQNNGVEHKDYQDNLITINYIFKQNAETLAITSLNIKANEYLKLYEFEIEGFKTIYLVTYESITYSNKLVYIGEDKIKAVFEYSQYSKAINEKLI